MTSYERPVLFFVNGIGDQFLNWPAVRALAEHFAGRLAFFGQSDHYDLFFRDLPFRAVHTDPFGTESGARRFALEPAKRFCRGTDLFLSLNPWTSDQVEELVAGVWPARSIGFFPYFSEPLELDYSIHSVDHAFRVVRRVDDALRPEAYSAMPAMPAVFRELAAAIRAEAGSAGRLLVVHADTLPEKMLPRATLVEVLTRFLSAQPDFLALIVGSQDLALDTGPCSERIIPCYGIPLGASISLVAAADLFLGVDSCMLHAADTYGVPGVGVFGPTDTHEFGFRFGLHRHVRACRSLANLEPESIVRALDELLRETRSRRPLATEPKRVLA